ncbi:CGGC domain-containing protein [Desulfosporosinus sp. SRJS8]|nr:CGGC domain-containing protein [Desulfosporosinus sp. SRJS8]
MVKGVFYEDWSFSARRNLAVLYGTGLPKAFFQRKDSFARYAEELELLTFTHTGGDLNRKIKNMIQAGIESVHLSSCLRRLSS